MSVSVDVESERGFSLLEELFMEGLFVKLNDEQYEARYPERELVVESLRSFCQNYESLKKVNVEDFLSCDEFQKYYKVASQTIARLIIQKGGEKYLEETDPRALNYFKKKQKEQVSFLYFLKDYWKNSTDGFDAGYLSSRITGYLPNHSTALILEQLSKGLSYTDSCK